jgi:glycosyltransferase involved in cell wall biosynthesis
VGAKRIAIVYGSVAGTGGLGLNAATVISGLARTGREIHAFGPGYDNVWPLIPLPENVTWHRSPPSLPRWRSRFTALRWRTGELQLENDLMLGRWAALQVARLKPDLCYTFTQVGFETLRWCKSAGIPSILENPNGHIRNYRTVYERESSKWGCGLYHGHPAIPMVERVEREYELATRIRVSSVWSLRSMADHGVDDAKISVLDQPLDLTRFCRKEDSEPAVGPLRVCFVGSLDLRKGFVYLLRAIRLIGPQHAALNIIGATGDRCSKALLARESSGLQMSCAPGDPVPAYKKAELAVVPSLEDGQPFVTAEAMASALPVVVSSACGSAGWVTAGSTGWIIEPASAESIASALESALSNRDKLRSMGLEARRITELRAGPSATETFSNWVLAL